MAKALDMTQGKPASVLVQFSVPLILGNLLNQVYSITDSIIVGRVLGQTSLAAIGVCMPIVFLIASFAFGLNAGVSIIFSQCVGEKNVSKMRSVYANSIYIGLILAIGLAVIGYPLVRPILTAMGTPEGPMAEAIGYLRISIITTGFPIFYWMFSNVARGLGDGYTSLYFLIMSVVSNIILDILFVVFFGWGVNGSAYATALSQAISVVFAYFTLWRKYPQIRLKKTDMKLEFKWFKAISAVAFPIALQSAFNNLGNIVVQSCVNGFGEVVMAAYTAASRLSSFFLLPVENLANAMSVYTGQNYGARKDKRIRDGVKASFGLELIISIVIAVIILIFGKQLTMLFLDQTTDAIISTSKSFLLFSTVPAILFGVMNIYQQVLRGSGKTNASVIGGFMQLGGKVVIALVGAYFLKSSTIIWLAWPISYIIGTIYPLIVYIKHSKNNFGMEKQV